MLKSRLPALDAILPVFAVISFLVYGWTLVVFLWKVPSWMMFLTFGEILSVFAYSMTSAFLESLAALAILLLASMLLPARWMREVFVTRGSVAALFGLGSIMLYMYRLSVTGYAVLHDLFPWTWIALALSLLLTFLAPRLRFVIRSVAWISDRLIVFLFLLLPISLVSVIVVIVRNLF
ncbi:MAG: hypothetical protein C4583_09785 [Anaerolineaceae bacterium]|nr:MAG: hypothetical protein C4583_09785 [Anaerolineaceae bacterium]